jgi:membrane protein implicated in regulation of membrane protease activity
MGFDVRLALGSFFVFIGLLLAAFGAASPAALFQRSLGINIDLWWGLVLLAFGAGLLGLAIRARRRHTRAAGRTSARGARDDGGRRGH